MNDPLPAWEAYERMIAQMMKGDLPTSLCVTPNAQVTGKITGIKRQIDVLVDLRHDTDNSCRIVVDAKNKKRKIDVKDVESFLGMMNDVAATHGYLVCPAGFTETARKRAQDAITICLVSTDHIPDFNPLNWPKCEKVGCKNGRIFWDGHCALSLVLRPLSGTSDLQTVEYFHHVGKCDKCGLFHVHCLTCGKILAIPHDIDEDYGHQCSCKMPWFWIASVEEDESGSKSAELHGVRGTGEVMTVDRRPM